MCKFLISNMHIVSIVWMINLQYVVSQTGTSQTTVAINISEDKNAPVFLNSPYSTTITENYVVGRMAIAVAAVDSNPVSSIRYMIEPPGPRYFTINEATGNITVAKELNTSLETTFQFKVSIYDSGEPQYKSTAYVTIFVIRNLNAPRFIENPISVTVDQNAKYNFMVANTTAEDADGDILRYTMTGNPLSEVQTYFGIDPDNGDIFLRELLTSPPRQSYQLFVFARDQRLVNEKTGTATVNVFIDFDDAPRYLDNLPYPANIQESQSINSPVAQMRGTDPDLKGNLTYESIGMYPAEDYFSVGPSSGTVSLIRDLKSDPSGLQTYTLRVVIYDSMYPRLKATGDVVINVVRNPFAPQFSPNADYRATVQENVTLGYQVLDIDATDSDNDPVTFEIVNSAPSGGENFFYLDPNTGVLMTKRLLTNTPETFYQLTVQASDGRGRAANATASITITRIPSDQRPVFISTPNATITFKQPVSSSVITVAAQDPNPVGNIRYELVGIFPAQDFFAVNPTTGSVTVTRDLATDSFETMQYTLRLEAYDTNNPNLRGVGLSFITVIRNPAAPVFSAGDYSHVAEETLQVGAKLFDINATDADGDPILYDIVQDQNGIAGNEFFLLNRDSGKFYLMKDLRLTTQNAFSFRVKARDQGRPEKFATANVLISVTRDNGPPTFIQRDYIFEVSETEPVNNIIPFASIKAQDVPTRGSLVYEEDGDGFAMSYFALDRNTGAIKVEKSLLTTNESYFELKATAYDTFYPDNKANTTVKITVRRNQNEPQFSQSAYNTEINEYHQFGVTVFRVLAADADRDVVLFSIEPPNDFFYIEKYSGRIYLRRSPSINPTVSEYTFLVLASDQRSPPRIANATMTIRIRRNQPPVILELPFITFQSENTPVDTVVYTVKATDPDMRPGSRLVYTLIGDGSGPTFFSLNNLTGEIRIKAGFWNDIALQYVLRISVYDQEIMDMRTTSTFTINALRNTNQPRFNQRLYVYNITETTQPSTVVGQPSATDFDGDRLQYFLTGDATAREYFYVNRDTAEIILIKNLDTTAVNTFNLQLRVEDGRVPLKTDTVQVTINVARDLELPIFINDPYNFNTDEERPVNHTLGTVTAIDPDIRSRIQYEVVGIYPAPSFFDADKDSGVMRIIRDLKEDHFATGTYVLRISAFDSRDPSKNTLTDVTITVARNVNPPVFDRTTYSTRITELYSMGIPVLNITATDPEGTQISYTLVRDNTVGGNALVYFYIDANGGLYLRKPLTAPDVPGQFSMVVAATDLGRPSRTTEVNIIVGVDGVGKINPPVFRGTPYTRRLEERTLNGTSIITVSTNPSTDIVYEIVGEPPAPYLFFVEGNGDIHIKKDLTTDKSMEYKIRVRAYQRNTPSKYAETDVVVTMLRNTNPPTFTPDSFSTSVNYDDPVGNRVLQVQAADIDQDVLQYNISGDADCQNSFYIISATGEIFLVKSLKTTNDVLFQCTLSVTDNGYPTPKTDTATLVINVVRGTNPVFGNQNLNVNIREDMPVSTVVENRISAIRTPAPHSPDTMVYEIIGQYPAQSFFGVDRLTGQISVIQDLRLDGLKTTQYKILILTYGTDKPDHRSTATVTIDVQRNLNGPRFFPQSDSIELPETTSTDFWSMPQNVTDPDSSKITCSIIGDSKSVEYFQVDPNTCVLSLKKSLKDDPDLTTTYNVLIEAVDNEQSPLTNRKTITITVFRDASPPSFQNLPATITISETRTVGDSVYAASATENWRGKIQYEIVGVYPAPSFFDVDKYSGVIRIIRDLKEDRIATEIYTLLIAVYDTKNHNSKATSEVIINVKRKPATFEFSQTIYVVQLPEITPVGSRILQVFPANASDSAIYAIETSFPLSGVNIFNMDAFNGIITTRMSLHSGTNYFYQLEVKATDKSNPLRTGVTTVFVIVEDFCCLSNNRTCELNSNAPIFSAPLYFVNVMEGDYSTNNLPLIEVSASDNDFGPDGNLVFEIQSVSNNGDGKFQIQQKPSEKKATLICIGKISRDLTYVIVVRASDQAIHVSRKRSSSVPVEIKVVPFRK